DRGLSDAKNIINVVTNSIKIVLNSNARNLYSKPDIHIRPNLFGFNLSDHKQIKNLIELGYNETMKKIDLYF
ncbi:MAG: hypothetical protein PF487_05720, partial [Bacteroidales bacterium]|nr:hypothetical protein [Bacteroidales bacterium]